MGELILATVVDATISNLISAVAQQINLAVSWKQELIILKGKLVLIQAVLEDAGRRHVTDPSVTQWLIKLREVAEEADYILDEGAYESVKRRVKIQNQMMKKVRYFLNPINRLAFGLRMACKIRSVIAMVDGINKEAHGFGLQQRLAATDYQPRRRTQTHSFSDSSHVVGREDDVSQIVQLLIDPANQLRLCVISIVGMPGLGKTTLAQSVRSNDQIQKHFGKIMWVCVSETFDVEEILAEMLESLTKKTCAIRNKDTVVQEIRAAVGENNYLLILDDVWNEESEKWEDLKSCLLGICNMSGNRVVVTTRSEKVTSTMETLPEHIHQLGKLKDVECWHIIKLKVCENASTALNPELENIGLDIAKKCGGVPLVANVIGGTLRQRGRDGDEWLSIKSKIDALGSLEYLDRIRHVLQLSFDHLPNSSLKQCFVFCSIFPKEYVMEREILIQLWMAEGFLQPPEETSITMEPITMENIGDGYFNDLLSYSLFQGEKRDSFGNIAFCKMHDLIHDFAQFISKSEMIILKSLSGGSISNFKHLNLICDLQTAPTSLGDVAQLRTLFAKHGFPCGMSGKFKRLRVLNFGAVADTKDLPACFGNMKSLRYLDISSSQIKELPRFITNLYNLQTFRFLNCRSLKMPPKGIGNLINLRHIYFNNENCMPANLGRLTCLQTLQLFFVSATKGCKIEELGCLSQLRGRLEIRNLELVKDKSEAMKAKLDEKVFDCLRLVWGKEGNQDADVLEGLQPDSYLQRLEIDGYGGKNLPSWMLKTDSSFNCQTLLLMRCKKLECFPVMKGFSSLKVLHIQSCDELSTIADGALAVSTSLKELHIEDCPKLEGVLTSGLPSLETLQIGNCNVSSIGDILATSRCLKKLRINRCNNLIAIPEELKELHSLVELNIKNCSKVRSIPENLLNCLTSLKQLTIGGFSKEIEEFPGLSSIHHLNGSLESLDLMGWEKLKMLPPQIQRLTTLKKLYISHFDEMEALPEWLGSLFSLKLLCIGKCSRLRCLSSGLPFCTSLEILIVVYCANLISISEEVLGRLTHLTTLVIGGFSNELEEFPCLNSISTSLRSLTLIGWEKLSQLPHQIPHLTALKDLGVYEFDGVEVLPDWLGNLSSLESLMVARCKNLKQLPSVEAIPSLSNLRVLTIKNCPLLEERCTKESGPEWSKISHVPTILINGKPI